MQIDTTKMSSRGQVVIPLEMRKDIKEGEKLIVIRKNNEITKETLLFPLWISINTKNILKAKPNGRSEKENVPARSRSTIPAMIKTKHKEPIMSNLGLCISFFNEIPNKKNSNDNECCS